MKTVELNPAEKELCEKILGKDGASENTDREAFFSKAKEREGCCLLKETNCSKEELKVVLAVIGAYGLLENLGKEVDDQKFEHLENMRARINELDCTPDFYKELDAFFSDGKDVNVDEKKISEKEAPLSEGNPNDVVNNDTQNTTGKEERTEEENKSSDVGPSAMGNASTIELCPVNKLSSGSIKGKPADSDSNAHQDEQLLPVPAAQPHIEPSRPLPLPGDDVVLPKLACGAEQGEAVAEKAEPQPVVAPAQKLFTPSFDDGGRTLMNGMHAAIAANKKVVGAETEQAQRDREFVQKQIPQIGRRSLIGALCSARK